MKIVKLKLRTQPRPILNETMSTCSKRCQSTPAVVTYESASEFSEQVRKDNLEVLTALE
jgi:hypothetical protein